jgi:predicted esterase YcpF (UPF0227 family)
MKIFLHGLESSSRGAKAAFLRDLYPDMLIPDFKGSLTERMASLHAILAGQKNIIVIGSSFGGLMATIFANLYYNEVEDDHMLARTFRELDWKTMLYE